jgi:hypothetical protein
MSLPAPLRFAVHGAFRSRLPLFPPELA